MGERAQSSVRKGSIIRICPPDTIQMLKSKWKVKRFLPCTAREGRRCSRVKPPHRAHRFNLGSHLILETHGWDVASHGSVFLVVTTLRLRVEFAVREGFFKARAVDFVEMNRTHAWGRKRRKGSLPSARATVW